MGKGLLLHSRQYPGLLVSSGKIMGSSRRNMLGLLLQSSRSLGDMIVDEAVVLELGGCGLSSWKGKERKGRRLMRRLEARVAALGGARENSRLLLLIDRPQGLILTKVVPFQLHGGPGGQTTYRGRLNTDS